MRLVWIAPIVGLCLAEPATSQSPEQRVEWNRPTAPFRIIGNIHYVVTDALGAYLATTPQGHVLIDGAMPESADQIAANIRRLGFRLEDVKYLTISHAHMDHAGGLARLKALTGAKLLASAGDRPELESGKIAYRRGLDFPAVKVDRVVKDGEHLRIGDTTLIAHITPGHTKGCTSWTARIESSGKPKDVIFACSLTVAGQPLVNDAGYPSAAADFQRSFAKLKGVKADVFLSFHTGGFDLAGKRKRLEAGDASAFVDPAELGRQVAAAEAAFAKELARQKAGGAP